MPLRNRCGLLGSPLSLSHMASNLVMHTRALVNLSCNTNRIREAVELTIFRNHLWRARFFPGLHWRACRTCVVQDRTKSTVRIHRILNVGVRAGKGAAFFGALFGFTNLKQIEERQPYNPQAHDPEIAMRLVHETRSILDTTLRQGGLPDISRTPRCL